ncbi:MAG TPA: GNAT family N-acetyltransferase [Gammaproteobacteria bacterium]|nr:GNAT family N-acetyltransferase [Gammaproteobacteria bacterium]
MEFKNIYTPRLMIEIPKPKDAVSMHEAMRESFGTLKQWMPWAQTLAGVEDVELYIRSHEINWSGEWQEGIEAPLQIVSRHSGQFIGATGIKPLLIKIPSFEIGFWIRDSAAGNGLMTEAINGLTRYLFTVMGAKRCQIEMDILNQKSINVAKRLNFSQEATLRNYCLSADGTKISDTLIFGCTRISDLPELTVSW